jgi:threonine dehydrogenase-like Zn-dependent dehydrogenase
MRGAIIYGPRDIRFEERPDPAITEPTDAIVCTVATCVCGSDLWRYRGIEEVGKPTPIGHEYVGIVEAVGDEVSTVNPGQFVVGGFLTSDNTCPICKVGAHANCQRVTGYDGCQAELIRVQNADGTLLATPEHPSDDVIPSILTLSDVMCTGWHAAVCADVRPGSTVVVVGDGAVGLSGVLAASQLGAERVIAMSRHADRQALARDFGATDIVAERGDEGVAQIKELTNGIGADAGLECVGHPRLRRTGPPLRPPWCHSRLGRCPTCDRPAANTHVLKERWPARGPCVPAGVPARPPRARMGRPHRARKGLRPHPPTRPGR